MISEIDNGPDADRLWKEYFEEGRKEFAGGRE
jgi:hypothetical protein